MRGHSTTRPRSRPRLLICARLRLTRFGDTGACLMGLTFPATGVGVESAGGAVGSESSNRKITELLGATERKPVGHIALALTISWCDKKRPPSPVWVTIG
jgi:hypothetical protein